MDKRPLFAGPNYDIVHDVTLGLELRHQIDEVTNTTPSYRVGGVFDHAYLATLVHADPNQIVGVTGKRTATFKAALPRVMLNWPAARDPSPNAIALGTN
ncbi:hypothetical protein WBP07_22225 (plasmid) [Novosphingobium sp. BL-8A]|uniref:hypothetical protein n=1 Tax=Novosphingobium sp. BL-8A TaxID=3127639 RepID=UPI003757C455